MGASGFRPYSSWFLAAAGLWSLNCAMFCFTFSEMQLGRLGELMSALVSGGALICAMVFVPMFVHDFLRPPPLAKPEPGGKVGGGLLRVGSAGDPMREPLGWLPKLHLHEASRRSMLASFACICAWWLVDLRAPRPAPPKPPIPGPAGLLWPLLMAHAALRRGQHA